MTEYANRGKDVLRFSSEHRFAFVVAFAAVMMGLSQTGCERSPVPERNPQALVINSMRPENTESRREVNAEASSETQVTASQRVTRRLTGPGYSDSSNRDELIAEFTRLLDLGHDEQAEKILRQMLIGDPEDYEALFHLARVTFNRGQHDEGLHLISAIPPAHPQLGIPALGVAADWCFELDRFDEAERRYLQIAKRNPQISVPFRQLAYLYNRQGRRHEAVEMTRQLCLAGDVTQEELLTLVVESDAIYYSPEMEATKGTRPYWPIGEMGQARYLWTQSRYVEAAELIEPLLVDGTANASEIAFYGAAISEAQTLEKFPWWLERVTDEVQQFPEYWSAIGTYQLANARFDCAVRCLAEAIRRDPTDIRSTRRMVSAFRSLGDTDQVDRWTQRFEYLIKTLEASHTIIDDGSSEQVVEKFAALLEQGGRNVEALLWRWIRAMRTNADQQTFERLSAQRVAVLREGNAFPDASMLLRSIDVDLFPLPQWEDDFDMNDTSASSRVVVKHVETPVFENVAESACVTHTYRVDVDDRESGFAIYQTFGGGVAVIDFDLDGLPDLYFAQGAAESPQASAIESDAMYRNLSRGDEMRFDDVTRSTGLIEDRYTLGVTAGDWNQDGFSDLVIANLGPDYLYLNQGDGTFVPIMLNPGESSQRLSTSVAIADVDDDQLPDIYMANYLDDADLSRRPPVDASGMPTAPVNPTSFVRAHDDVFVNDGVGNWVCERVGGGESDASTSLGILIGDLTDQPGNEVFVANDELPNQLWRHQSLGPEWADSAVSRGCAYASLGSPTGAMGIAAADFDGTGTIDLHVTNFYKESSNFYVSDGGLFRDLNVRYGFDRMTSLMLGFGCQSIDYSNNGVPDLAIVNGHVENLESKGQSFRQPMQLLANRGDRFESLDVEDVSGFWSTRHLGRALARVDLDRDGRSDLVVTDLSEPVAILMNLTASNHHWIDLQLVGTRSERDAIGASVEVHRGSVITSHWRTAGDGYLCNNESSIHVGLGNQSTIHKVIVNWPSGHRQTFDHLKVDRGYQLVEFDVDAFETKTTDSVH
ncbi:FG-GAP-like repeat-containing protein [Rhodopirellula sp. SWK7]|uniref:FG-GAP-like repeat-containing protein n=1 Tax=Rhodopirellula sp. SWK7 TaxID=595460 RepID=UPI001360B10D|nr:FG-GAP-like repeat-containing protein [Rhodopirellula sp. SWK7]